MRITLTLDDDVADKLRQLASRSQASLEATVNDVLRRGLTAQERVSATRKPFRLEPFRSPLRAGVDPLRLHQANDDLEPEAELCSNDADFARFAGLRWRNPLQPS